MINMECGTILTESSKTVSCLREIFFTRRLLICENESTGIKIKNTAGKNLRITVYRAFVGKSKRYMPESILAPGKILTLLIAA